MVPVYYITFKDPSLGVQKLPVKVSYGVYKNFGNETGKSVEAIDESIELYEPLLWFSLISGHKAQRKELKLKREDMEMILDDCFQEFVDILMKVALERVGGPEEGKKK